MSTDLPEQIRARYASAAKAVASGGTASCGSTAEGPAAAAESTGCCSTATVAAGCCATGTATGCCDAGTEPFGAGLYSAAERDELPSAAVQASLGCGNPLLVADLHPGETVLDLGSGGGIDVLLSARRVGPAGRAYGLDMTDEMLDLARRNAAAAGVSTVPSDSVDSTPLRPLAAPVEFLKGTIEEIPLPGASVDVIISNCVINLSLDKPAVFAEMFRVLRPGGRIGVSDVVAEDDLTPEQRAERGNWVGCTAGALSRREYTDGLAAAGFTDVEVRFTHPVASGMHSAVVRAVKREE